MIKALARRVAGRLLDQPRIKQFVLSSLNKSHPLLSNKQLAFAPPGHYYSPLPDVSILKDQSSRLYAISRDDGIEINESAQCDLLAKFAPIIAGFDWPLAVDGAKRYWQENPFFGPTDGAILYAMIQHFHPRRLIEVGSGYSSALILDVNDQFSTAKLQLTFIEPYPDDRLAQLLRPVDYENASLIKSIVQTVPLTTFDTLEANDILFIDSSHVSKLGSDVNHILFNILPRLKAGVLIHFHDIFYPFEYLEFWFHEGRAWNELYLLRAFLQFNNDFEIVFFNSFMTHQHPELLQLHAPRIKDRTGASIWLRKKR